MQTIIITIVTFLAGIFKIGPYVGKTIELNNDNQQNVVLNHQMVEYIPTIEIKPSTISKSITPTTTSNQWWKYPTDIKTVTRSGDDLLVLVNKEYKLSETYAPSDLVLASNSGIRLGEKFYLRNILINDLRSMVNAAKTSNIDLSIVSAYRSYATQVTTYNYWVSVNGGRIDEADKVSARAGHSQHQLGTAIDFSSSEISDGLSGTFVNTNASKWLVQNAWKYGFVLSFPSGYESITGYSYESWHYRYIGIANAKEMHNIGMILEKYLESKN